MHGGQDLSKSIEDQVKEIKLARTKVRNEVLETMRSNMQNTIDNLKKELDQQQKDLNAIERGEMKIDIVMTKEKVIDAKIKNWENNRSKYNKDEQEHITKIINGLTMKKEIIVNLRKMDEVLNKADSATGDERKNLIKEQTDIYSKILDIKNEIIKLGPGVKLIVWKPLEDELIDDYKYITPDEKSTIEMKKKELGEKLLGKMRHNLIKRRYELKAMILLAEKNLDNFIKIKHQVVKTIGKLPEEEVLEKKKYWKKKRKNETGKYDSEDLQYIDNVIKGFDLKYDIIVLSREQDKILDDIDKTTNKDERKELLNMQQEKAKEVKHLKKEIIGLGKGIYLQVWINLDEEFYL
uniref:Uncharacterized protein n=1 Tax=Mimivirus LCMiAC01 TaxID=2506608 RepID=A0A481Z0X6_9VIRU|nr:MAG: hypothetical protein LCMiAC01_01210 [Mimivirus LCMiAC01]